MLMFLEQAMGAATELTRGIIRYLIDRFLMDLPPIYGARCYLYGKISILRQSRRILI
jgi:hypothetical protein